MKKAIITILALVFSVASYAQLISDKTDKKVTVTFDLFQDFQLQTTDDWNAGTINPGFSTSLTYNLPLGNSKSNTVAVGLGLSTHNYYSTSRIDDPYAKELTFTQYADDDDFKRYKINPTYAEVPLELRFRINDAWKIGVGFKFGVMLSTKSKFIDVNDDDVTIREKYCGISNIERYAYSTTLRVGYKWVSAYASYQLSRVFTVGTNGPAITPLSVGVSFAPF